MNELDLHIVTGISDTVAHLVFAVTLAGELAVGFNDRESAQLAIDTVAAAHRIGRALDWKVDGDSIILFDRTSI